MNEIVARCGHCGRETDGGYCARCEDVQSGRYEEMDALFRALPDGSRIERCCNGDLQILSDRFGQEVTRCAGCARQLIHLAPRTSPETHDEALCRILGE